MLAITCVPSPGREWIVSWPPIALRRSRMLNRPCPVVTEAGVKAGAVVADLEVERAGV
jgi:hypothetical protein